MFFRDFDIYDLNYEFSSEEFGILNTPKENLPVKGIFIRILSLIRAFFFLLLKHKRNSNKISQQAILFFALNHNEMKPFENIDGLDSNNYIVGDDNYCNGFPLVKIYALSFLFIPIVLFNYIFTKNETKKLSFFYAFDSYCLSFAAIIILPKYFKKLNPKKIFVSNHTRPFHRIIMKLFNNSILGYIQHAAFIDNMPPFNGFNYLLIDGDDSLSKLINSKSYGNTIYKIGNSKYDDFLNFNRFRGEFKSIGVCVNNMDKIDHIKDIILSLRDNFPLLSIFLRPHPSDPRFIEMRDFSKLNNLNFSNSIEEDSKKFLKGIDVLLAGDSNIHLEAIYLNIPSIYINFKNKTNDWYGFLKKKMLYNGNTSFKIIDIIRTIMVNKKNVRNYGKYFNASIGTIYQGKSSLLASEIINNNYDFINTAFRKSVNDNVIFELNE